MKVAIIGGRDFNDYELLKKWQKPFWHYMSPDPLIIISGGANGADSLAEKFADEYKLEKEIYKPEWDKYGKSAGFIRNQTIVDNCDMVLAFWDGESRGTADTIEKAKKAKKPTFIIYFDKPKPIISKTEMKGL